MQRGLYVIMAGGLLMFGALAGNSGAAAMKGEAEFKEHCAVCHPNGGNIVNASKTLSKKDREAHHVMTEADILKLVRNPGPGMTKFDTKMLSDAEAKSIAEYIIKTFK